MPGRRSCEQRARRVEHDHQGEVVYPNRVLSELGILEQEPGRNGALAALQRDQLAAAHHRGDVDDVEEHLQQNSKELTTVPST